MTLVIVGAALTLACTMGAMWLRNWVHEARWDALALIGGLCVREP